MGWFGSNDIVTTNVEISTDTFLEHLNDLQGTKKFRLLEGLTAVVEGPIHSLGQIFTEGKVTKNIYGIVMDGIASQGLIDCVIQTNINVIVSEESLPLRQLQYPKDIVILTRTSLDSPEVMQMENNLNKGNKRNKGIEIIAREKEEHLDYEGALEIWVKLGNNKEAKRIRRKMMDEKKVDQTIVHGDYVDDRDTIVKDSVINRSNVGAGSSSKMQELEKLKEMFDSGFISKEEMENMKKEILGK
jgi:hypothetical protein